jgi:hypothetical protein
MSLAGRRLFHSFQVPFSAGSLPVFLQAGAGSDGGAGRAARAVTARNACASMDKVMCRYQAR